MIHVKRMWFGVLFWSVAMGPVGASIAFGDNGWLSLYVVALVILIGYGMGALIEEHNANRT